MSIVAIFLGLLTALCFSTLHAAELASPDVYRQTLQQGIDQGIYQQLAVGWIDGKQRHNWFLGKDIKPSAHSQFEIGAITQVFSGLLLAQAVYRGKVHLGTNLGDVLGADFSFSDSRLKFISLESLATHRAHLRAQPGNLFPQHADDPYATYGSGDLLGWLANVPDAIDASVNYSILDSGLLGFALGRIYATDFASALREQIFAPLAMQHTSFDDTSKLLTGHTSSGANAAHWHFGALAGAAGLRSTLPDLMNFIACNLRPDQSSLRAAMLLSRRAYTDPQAPQQFGLGWNIVMTHDAQQSWPLVWSASRTAGFSAFVGYRTDRQQGLVLLGNSDADLSALGLAWLQGQAPPSLPNRISQAVVQQHLADFVGLYQLPDASEVVVRKAETHLRVQWPGQVPIDLQPADRDVFVAAQIGLMLSFQREVDRVATVVIGHSGLNVLARRLSERAPHLERTALPVDWSLAAAMSGDYRYDAHNLLRIRASAAGISLQMTARPAIKLYRYANDRFFSADDSLDLLLVRNSSAAVTALELDLAGSVATASRVRWRHPVMQTLHIPILGVAARVESAITSDSATHDGALTCLTATAHP